MRVHSLVGFPACSTSPKRRNMLHDPRYRLRILVKRAEVPAFCKFETALRKMLCEKKVAAQRFQDKLPRPDRSRIPEPDRPAAHKGPHDVRNKLVLCPVAAANHISCPATRDNNSGLGSIGWIEIGLLKCGHHQFRTRFAVGIRIVSAQPIAFPVTPHPALVFVALV